MQAASLELDGIRFRYGDGSWDLDVPCLAFGARSLTGIVGPNGAGKSSLLRIAAGVLAPDAGRVTLQGRPMADLRRREIARVLAYLPQDTPSLYDYTVEDVVAMGRYPHLRGLGVAGPGDLAAVSRALDTVGMRDFRRRPLSHLSGGERRRALIASVLAQEPHVLLLDEPTSGLDLHHASDIMRRLARLADGGLGVVLVTHDINLASLFCGRIVLLHRGRVHADGRPQEVIRQDAMASVYGDAVFVGPHPLAGRPMVLPVLAPEADAAGGAP
jgi:iron complex transport system ATP-binding protein